MKEKDNVNDNDLRAVRDAVELTESLPDDVFAAVPDEDTVKIEISGAFSRAMQKTIEYIISTVETPEAIRALEFIKVDYKNCDTSLVKDHDVALWCMVNMVNEFNAQAGLQKKTKIYDKEKFMSALVDQKNTAVPLTDDEINSRVSANINEITDKIADDSDTKDKPSTED